MKRLLVKLGNMLGIGFAPDNHIVPILRLAQYHHIAQPGFFFRWPMLEQKLPAIHIGLRIEPFVFEAVYSQDHIPFTIHLTVMFTFDPRLAQPAYTSQLVRAPDDMPRQTVAHYVNQGLRQLAVNFAAEDLTRSAVRTTIRRDLSRYLKTQLRDIGIIPLNGSGILLKEILAPQKYIQSIINAKGLKITIHTLEQRRQPQLVELGTKAAVLSGLIDREGEMTILPPIHWFQDVTSAERLRNTFNGKEHSA